MELITFLKNLFVIQAMINHVAFLRHRWSDNCIGIFLMQVFTYNYYKRYLSALFWFEWLPFQVTAAPARS